MRNALYMIRTNEQHEKKKNLLKAFIEYQAPVCEITYITLYNLVLMNVVLTEMDNESFVSVHFFPSE